MKIEVIISDLSFTLEERCRKCLLVLESGEYNSSQKSYAACYLSYRIVLDKYELNKDIALKYLDDLFKANFINTFEKERWQLSILLARLYLTDEISDCWFWNFGTKEKLLINPIGIINSLRLINLSIACKLNDDNFITEAYNYGVELYRYFYSVVRLESISVFNEIDIVQKQIKILISLFKYVSTSKNDMISFDKISTIDDTQHFKTLFRKTLKLTN